MARASTRPDGVTAPVDRGFSSQERMNRTSSSKRRGFLSTSRIDCDGIVWDAHDEMATFTGKGLGPRGQALPGLGAPQAEPGWFPKPSRNSLTLAKNPADSGWVSP